MLARLECLVIAENDRQNLIAKSSIETFSSRHIDDSLQLLRWIPSGTLLDIGSGGGFPGLVLAIGREDPIVLVEPRRRRADFLRHAAAELGCDQVTVLGCRVQQVAMAPVRAITARAVASLTDLFAMASHLSDAGTRWVLPKGRTVRDELEVARRTWQGDFMLEPSRTDPEAAIVIAQNVRRIAR